MKTERTKYLRVYAATVAALVVAILIFFALNAETALYVMRENGPVEYATAAGYIVGFFLLCFAPSMGIQTRISLPFIFLVFFAKEIDLAALLGTHHIQFVIFRNPNVSLLEKVAVVILALLLIYSVGYLLFRYSGYVIRGALKLEVVPVGVILGISMLCISQSFDSLHSIAERADISLDGINTYGTILEEVSELGVAIVFLIAILAYITQVRRSRELLNR